MLVIVEFVVRFQASDFMLKTEPDHFFSFSSFGEKGDQISNIPSTVFETSYR